jgi:hypothetical protein
MAKKTIRTYAETRTDEVQQAAANGQLNKLLFLASHHVGSAARELASPQGQEPLNDLVPRMIKERLAVAELAIEYLKALGGE